MLYGSVLPTYFRFIKQTDDDAKRPEVSSYVLRVALQILLFEDVNQSLKSKTNRQGREEQETNID